MSRIQRIAQQRPVNSQVILMCLVVIGTGSAAAQDKGIDTAHSAIAIHVRKAGVFSAAGHEHWVDAAIAHGVLNDTDRPRIEFRVEAATMKVRSDPKVNARDQAQIQADMQEKALESGRYPEIAFRSSRSEKQSNGTWSVEGLLTLHGVTKPVGVIVARRGDAYVSRVVIRQTDYGIKPISAVGGTVKVKNELEIDFRIVARTR